MESVHTTALRHYPLLRRGKVRDVYDLGDHLLMVATDRISAFDVVMAETIPEKGALLTAIAAWWFDHLAHVMPNHVISTSLDDVERLTDDERAMLAGRSMVVRRTRPLPVECVVRGYLAGSGWKEYRTDGTVCGIPLPEGLVESSPLPEPIFTPATKAEEGHDENIDFARASDILGTDLAERVRDRSIALYQAAADTVRPKGLLLADTKFEFGITDDGTLIVIDEVLTPDSSRYWLAADYAPGRSQQNFDKQLLRDWLETTTWNKMPPPPPLPDDVVTGTRQRYIEAYERITGKHWA